MNARRAPRIFFLIKACGSGSMNLGWDHGQEHRPADQGNRLCPRSDSILSTAVKRQLHGAVFEAVVGCFRDNAL